MLLLHAKFSVLMLQVLGRIETVEDQQKKASSQRKAKQAGPRDKGLHGRPYLGPMLEATREEPATLPAVLVKDEETVSKEVQTVSDSQLETHQLRGQRHLRYASMLFLYILIAVSSFWRTQGREP